MKPTLTRSNPLRPGRFAREASAKRFVSHLNRLGFLRHETLREWYCENRFGFASDAPLIGDLSHRPPTDPQSVPAAAAQSPEAGGGPLRVVTIPTKTGYIHIKQSPRASFAIDRMPAEEVRRVLKQILGCQAVQQPHGGIGADALPLERQHTATNPGDLKRESGFGTGQGCPESSSERQGSLDAIDPPQSEQFAANLFRRITARGSAGGTQEQVRPIRALGKNDVPVLEVRVCLNVESQFIGR